jgi:hypothetical protein
MRHHQILSLFFLIATLCWLSPMAGGAEQGLELIPEAGPWVVGIWAPDTEAVGELEERVDVWRAAPKGEDGKFLVLAAVSGEELSELRGDGFEVHIDRQRTLELHQPRPTAEGAGGIPGYPCYRTVEETFTTAESLVASRPDLASWVDIGDSWNKVHGAPGAGYDLRVLVLTNSAVPGPKPKLMILGGIHAREYTTAELVTRFAEMLVAGHGVDPEISWLLDHHEAHLALQTNPDGRKMAETGLSWRKNVNDTACGTSDYGVDLNRNFLFEWGCCGGSSGSGCTQTYRGTSAGSEPETHAVQDYLRSIFPDQRPDDLVTPAPNDATGVMLDLHSFGGDVLWSWGFTTTQPPNGPALYTLGRKFAYFNGYRPQHGSLGTVDGATKDFAYGDLGVPGYTIELGSAFFEDCGSFEQSILPDNLESLLYTLKVVRTPYQTPAGPEMLVTTGTTLTAAPGDLVEITATADDTRYSNANGTEPVQNVAAAELYVDTPPWSSSPTPSPQAMTADDGAFDEPVELVTTTLDTTGLALGRHLVYLRGQDADGAWGATTGLFLYILDPVTAPRLAGVVRDARSNLPLAATVRAGSFQTTSDPGTGAYTLLVPEGTYDVVASAAEHADVTVADVVATSSQTTTVNFDLPAFETVLEEDGETGTQGWSTQAPWALTTEAAHSPTHSWTDSPGGSYGDNVSTSLTSPVLDLGGYTGTSLSWWQIYDLESGYDFGYVEVSTNGGSSWTTVATVNGLETTWHQVTVPVPQLDGQPNARLRFRLESDVSITRDGWHVDDIRLRSAPATPNLTSIFTDGFEAGDLDAWSARFP